VNYTQLTDQDVRRMLDTIGVDSVDDFFAAIPAEHRLRGGLKLPAGLSEPELLADVRALAGRNRSTQDQTSFLGAGIYDRFIPVLVDALALQGEFLTAYTPYQAEASQGVLQAFFEFQTMICQITGMDIANASLYEGASTVAEAVLMARAVNGRSRVLISAASHPDTRRVLQTYVRALPVELVDVPADGGRTPVAAVRAALDKDTSAVVVQHPNFFGALEDLPALAAAAHEAGALLIAAVDPISCGLLKRPGDCGADIVVGEGQGLGIPQSYGGPVLGFMACRGDYLRKMPGRLVGQTTDRDGRRGFCLTLQTREQHIRREKATSNICTNQGLLAMRAAVYLCAMGRRGLAGVARQSFDKAHYAASQIARLPRYRLRFEAPFFQEFVVQTDHKVGAVLEAAARRGILAGVPLGSWFPQLGDCFMVAVTEKRTRGEIDLLVEALRAV
jgi:glycine dehydrogenase subunit 1